MDGVNGVYRENRQKEKSLLTVSGFSWRFWGTHATMAPPRNLNGIWELFWWKPKPICNGKMCFVQMRTFQRSLWWTIARSTSSLGQHLSFYELFPMQPGLFLVQRNSFEAWSWRRSFLVLVQGMVGSQESWAYFRTKDFNCSCLTEEVQSHHLLGLHYIYATRCRDLIVFMSRFISCRQLLNCTHIHSYTLWGVW